jgi:hypothetical protein
MLNSKVQLVIQLVTTARMTVYYERERQIMVTWLTETS